MDRVGAISFNQLQIRDIAHVADVRKLRIAERLGLVTPIIRMAPPVAPLCDM